MSVDESCIPIKNKPRSRQVLRFTSSRFHKETSQLTCIVNGRTGFDTCAPGRKYVELVRFHQDGKPENP